MKVTLTVLCALALCFATTLTGCDEGTPDAGPSGDVDAGETSGDTAGDADDKEGRSYYRLVIDTEFEEPLTIERDITGNTNNFAFGSTHIAPAVSFAVSENLTFPATMSIKFNFGIVLGSADYPVQCDSAGEYTFGGAPPEIDIIKGLRYVSSVPGSTGSITVTSWSRTTGDVFKGTFSGRIRQLTDNVEKRWADVEGEFQFIIPEPAQGQ